MTIRWVLVYLWLLLHLELVCEKHFTISRADGGVDSSFSLEPHELENLVIESKRCWQSLGKVFYGATAIEENSLIFRRSIYVAADILPGEKFTSDNIKIIRPGDGAPPSLYKKLLGITAKHSYSRGTPLPLEDLLV